MAVGRIVGAHGLKGELKVYPLSNIEDRYNSLKLIYLEMPDGRLIKSEVEYSNPFGEFLIMKIKEISDRAAAEEIKGAFVSVTIEDVAELVDESFYIFDLEGLEVFSPEGEILGTVIRVEEFPANDIIVIKTEISEIMVPAVREFIKEINLAEKKIVAVLPNIAPPGL